MPKFSVDVKAFMTVRVEAANVREARNVADEFVEACDPQNGFIDGYNSVRAGRAIEPHTVINCGGFAVDGSSDVERVCSDCDEIFEDPADGGVCLSCLEERAEQKHNATMLDGCETEDELNAELRAQTQGR